MPLCLGYKPWGLQHQAWRSFLPGSCPHPGMGLHSNYSLPQGLANFFYKGPENKYFRLRGPYNLCCSNQSSHCYTDELQTVHELMSIMYFSKILFIESSARPDLAHSLLTPAVVCQKFDLQPPHLKFKSALNLGQPLLGLPCQLSHTFKNMLGFYIWSSCSQKEL